MEEREEEEGYREDEEWAAEQKEREEVEVELKL